MKKKILPFESKVWLCSPTMYPESARYMEQAYETNWMSTVGENIDEAERLVRSKVGCGYAVALDTGTSAIHLAVRLAGVKRGDFVFCSDSTFCATANPISYEGGVPIFIDAEYDTWNMDPKALAKAFDAHPEVKVVVLAHLYGVPGKMDEILQVCKEHGATLIEDAAESFGASYKGRQTGSFGTYGIISFNGNKIITGSSGGMLLTDSRAAAEEARKLSTQAREDAPWYEHEAIGYNYRMSNVIAGVLRGQFPYLEKHIEQKKAIYLRYKEGFKDLPATMNPYDGKYSQPNFWISCMLIDGEAMCGQVLKDKEAVYVKEKKKTCPSEILKTLSEYNAEGRPIWKPMHMQPIYRNNEFFTRDGLVRAAPDICAAPRAPGEDGKSADVGMDLFVRGLCLPSDNKMTKEQQDIVIEIVKGCFD